MQLKKKLWNKCKSQLLNYGKSVFKVHNIQYYIYVCFINPFGLLFHRHFTWIRTLKDIIVSFSHQLKRSCSTSFYVFHKLIINHLSYHIRLLTSFWSYIRNVMYAYKNHHQILSRTAPFSFTQTYIHLRLHFSSAHRRNLVKCILF